jgi:hypothetical protein
VRGLFPVGPELTHGSRKCSRKNWRRLDTDPRSPIGKLMMALLKGGSPRLPPLFPLIDCWLASAKQMPSFLASTNPIPTDKRSLTWVTVELQGRVHVRDQEMIRVIRIKKPEGKRHER